MTHALCAVADIGSATVHLLIARLSDDGTLQTYHEESVRPLLGARRTADGTIPADAEAEVLAALCHYQDVATDLRVSRLLVVATEAVRNAPNGTDLIARWQRALALPIVALTPSQETRLAILGAYGGAIPEEGLFADSGGASTQVAVIAGRAVLWQRSLPLGASSLTAVHLAGDPPTAPEVATASDFVQAALATLPAAPVGAGLRPVITGGSAATLQSLALNGCVPRTLTTSCLAQAEAFLVRDVSRSIAQRFSLPMERARILGAGCLIVHRLLLWSGYDSWCASVAGLREGLIRAWSADPQHWFSTLTE